MLKTISQLVTDILWHKEVRITGRGKQQVVFECEGWEKLIVSFESRFVDVLSYLCSLREKRRSEVFQRARIIKSLKGKYNKEIYLQTEHQMNIIYFYT